MQSGVKDIVRLAFWLLPGTWATAQTTTDSSAVISFNASTHASAFQKKPAKHFYDALLPGRRGLQPTILYNSADRLFVGLAYNDFGRDWRPDSNGYRQAFYSRYSVNQNAFSLGYQAVINRIAGNWSLYADAVYDWIKWTNFYGVGNETVQRITNAAYYRVRSRDVYLGFRFQHRLGRQGSLAITPFYQHIQLLHDEGRFLNSTYSEGKNITLYKAKDFGGLAIDVLLQRLNDLLLPTKGVSLSSGVAYTRNLGDASTFATYSAGVKWYLPFLNRFVFVMENGIAAVAGQPQFYQLASIGGGTLRGYRSNRFWGQTVFHNNNEVQYLFNAPAKLFKGKLGLTAFADQGRVWLKGEESNAWHYGYGGGVLIAVYNKLYLAAQVGVSRERKGFHFAIRRSL